MSTDAPWTTCNRRLSGHNVWITKCLSYLYVCRSCLTSGKDYHGIQFWEMLYWKSNTGRSNRTRKRPHRRLLLRNSNRRHNKEVACWNPDFSCLGKQNSTYEIFNQPQYSWYFAGWNKSEYPLHVSYAAPTA